MLPTSDLRLIAEARLEDAKALVAASRYDGAVYLGGYAVEIALKIRICKTLNWIDYPMTRGEFQNYGSFRTHDLDVLLHLSGVETDIKLKFLADWSTVTQWNPELRYKSIGSATRASAAELVQSAEKLVRFLC